MSNATHETAPTEFVQVGGVRFAYRRFGRPGDLPLLLLNYFAAKDVIVTPINALILAQHLPDAQLVVYPDASHGAQSQHAGVFLGHARMFKACCAMSASGGAPVSGLGAMRTVRAKGRSVSSPPD